jgi:hypothetical protein
MRNPAFMGQGKEKMCLPLRDTKQTSYRAADVKPDVETVPFGKGKHRGWLIRPAKRSCTDGAYA